MFLRFVADFLCLIALAIGVLALPVRKGPRR